MAPSGTLSVLTTREESAMFAVMLPHPFSPLLAAFRSCFTAPSYQIFQWLISGWVHCRDRHTITAIAWASGAIGHRHRSAFGRFFSRAPWSLDALGRVLFTLALPWLPADQPLYVLIDDTLARKSGKCIALGSMHHDPLRSRSGKPFCSFGHVWVVLALWVPLPLHPTHGFALPLLCRLYVGAKRGGQRDAPGRRTGSRHRAAQAAYPADPRPTKLALARELVALVAQWAGTRPVYVVADSAYAARPLLEDRPANVHVLSRLRLDAALWARAPRRRPGQKGRPRRRGVRLPTPKVMAARYRRWQALPLTLYGRAVCPQVFRGVALWYHALRDAPVQFVVVRDPRGQRRDEVFFCTDLTVSPAFLLEGYARRWTLEVTFHDAKQHLGFEHPQQQCPAAVRRTAPFAFVVYDLVLLQAAHQQRQGAAPTWTARPWYRRNTAPSFADLLAGLRRPALPPVVSAPPLCPRCAQNLPSWSPPAASTAA
jgi:hypothetical protein